MLKSIAMSFGFLTRIPVKVHFESFEHIAKKMWLFPMVGWTIGCIAGLMAFLLDLIVPAILMGFMVLGFLLWVTGAHHTDGLFDFGDGLMVMGPPEKKIEVMHDVAIGAGGLTLGILVIACTGISIGTIPENVIVVVCLVELNAKYALQVACVFGKNAHTKTASTFIEKNTPKDLLKSTLLSFILVCVTIFGVNQLLFMIIDLITPNHTIIPITLGEGLIFIAIFFISTTICVSLINHLSNKHFNGLTGDGLGALHELTRLINLVLMIIFLSF